MVADFAGDHHLDPIRYMGFPVEVDPRLGPGEFYFRLPVPDFDGLEILKMSSENWKQRSCSCEPGQCLKGERPAGHVCKRNTVTYWRHTKNGPVVASYGQYHEIHLRPKKPSYVEEIIKQSGEGFHERIFGPKKTESPDSVPSVDPSLASEPESTVAKTQEDGGAGLTETQDQ